MSCLVLLSILLCISLGGTRGFGSSPIIDALEFVIQKPSYSSDGRKSTHSLSQEGFDAVILWVNGSDPSHHKLLSQHHSAPVNNLPLHLRLRDDKLNHFHRFHELGELRYVLRSLDYYTPFVTRKSVVVSDFESWRQYPQAVHGVQVPVWWRSNSEEKCGRVIVPHSSFFSDVSDSLPTFNSFAIESQLWRLNYTHQKVTPFPRPLLSQ